MVGLPCPVPGDVRGTRSKDSLAKLWSLSVRASWSLIGVYHIKREGFIGYGFNRCV
jgi:hypothetical protein